MQRGARGALAHAGPAAAAARPEAVRPQRRGVAQREVLECVGLFVAKKNR